MSRSLLGAVLLTVTASSCGHDTHAGWSVPSFAALDESGAFRIELRNPYPESASVENVAASCPCVTFRELPGKVGPNAVAHVDGTVDRKSAPDRLMISFLLGGERHQVSIDVSGAKPAWDRGVVYRTGIGSERDLGEVAGVYANGSKAEVETRLGSLAVQAPGVRRATWSPLRPVEDIPNRWFAGLRLELDPDAGPEPVTGLLEVEGARIRLVLVFEPTGRR